MGLSMSERYRNRALERETRSDLLRLFCRATMLKNTENVDDQCRTSRMIAYLYWRLNLQGNIKQLQYNVGQRYKKKQSILLLIIVLINRFCFEKISAFRAHSPFFVLLLM